MADIADITGDRAELEAPYLVAASRRPSGPVANGSCHFCSERVPEPMRWCDADCRAGYEHEQERLGVK